MLPNVSFNPPFPLYTLSYHLSSLSLSLKNKHGRGFSGLDSRTSGSVGVRSVPRLAVHRHSTESQKNCHRTQRRVSPPLGLLHHGRPIEERRFGGPNDTQQHHGVDPSGHNGDHAQLPHRRVRELELQRRRVKARVWQQEPDSLLGQALLPPPLLPPRLPLQCSGHPLLRARELLPHRALVERQEGLGRVRREEPQPWEPLLVTRAARILPVVSPLPLDLRANPDGGLFIRHGLRALFPRHDHELHAPPSQPFRERKRGYRWRGGMLMVFRQLASSDCLLDVLFID